MFKNFFYNILYHVFSLLTPLIVTPYITRVIEQSLIGTNALVSSRASILCTLATLGMGTLGVRTIAKARDNCHYELNNTFFKLFYIQLTMYLLVSVGYIVYCYSFNITSKLQYLYLLYIFSSMFDVSWFFQGVEEFKYISIRNIAIRIISTLAVFLFVKEKSDIEIYVVCLYAPQLLFNLLMLSSAKKKYNLKIIKFNFDTNYFKSSLLLAIPAISISIYTIVDKIILGLFRPAEDVAVYEQGQSLIRIILSVVSAWSVTVFPKVSNILGKDENREEYLSILKKSSNFIFFISFALFWGAVAVNEVFISWYLPESYAEVVDVIYICAPMIIIVSFEQIFGMQVLLPFGNDKKYTISLICSACINCILDFITIPHWGIKAACVCSVLAELVALLLQMIFCRNIINLKDMVKGCVVFFAIGIIMFAVIRILFWCLPSTIIFRVFACVAGASLYLILSIKKLKAFYF